MKKKKNSGFSLLELLIVIAIIAILSVALVIVLNPAETLKKSRDAQRISDLSTLKTAIGLYLTSITSPTLGSTDDTGTNPRTNFSNTACQGTVGTFTTGEDRIYYSLSDGTTISDDTIAGVTFTSGFGATQVSSTYNSLTDGTGWIPIKFNDITGGSPISNLPIDPVNSVATGTSTAIAMTSDAQVYRYACSSSPIAFEIDATLESAAYGVGGTDDKAAKDGGNSTTMYETGTNLTILPANGSGTAGF
jgi:prepilin-type N-terminal cleavage/methylation domain-containing protein